MPLPPLKEPPQLGPRIKRLLVAVPAAWLLFSTLLLGNLAQMLSLSLLPFSRRAFRKVNREVADWWWGMCVILSRRIYGIHLELYGDEVPMRENAVVLANHQQMPDITFLMILARSRDRLGDLKWFVKDQLKWVPGVGWGMVFLDCVFVKRDWTADAASIEQTFSRILRDQVPLWLVTFPEGTRLKPNKLTASQDYAAKNGLPTLQHVLLPRTKGFVASVAGLRKHLDAVYDVTIAYEKGVPTLWQYVKGLAPVAHLHLHRVPMDELPEEDEALAAWLMERFEQKDRLLEGFYRDGVFPGE